MRGRPGRGLLVAVLTVLTTAAGSGDLATVARRTVAEAYTAYAEVQPIRTTTISATVTGTVNDLTVVQGDAVGAGQALVRLTGNEQAAEAARARTEVTRAESALDLARKKAAEVEATYPDLSTRQEVEAAQAAVREASATLDAVQAALANHEQAVTVRSLAAGTVLRVEVADGDRVTAGSPLLRLEPEDGLWVRATFYGSAAAGLKAGMSGRFEPAGGGKGIAVKVRSVAAAVDPDGGRRVGCAAAGAGAAAWFNGERGTLRLHGPSRTWAAVPTPAMVLDAGRWWVMVQDEHGPRRQEVVVGPEEDGWTLIRSGLEPGQRVVVKDAYLVFHRTFSEHYRPPD